MMDRPNPVEDPMTDDALRHQLTELLDGAGAHMSFDEAVADFPDEAINLRPPNVDYTPWHLLEHLRLTQADILDYVTNADYVEPHWPADYWPDGDATASRAMFDATIDAFRRDLGALRALVADPARDLFAVIPGTPGHTLLREARIDADHNAYHIGEFAILRQVMGTWPASH
jgi:DinB superfamily